MKKKNDIKDKYNKWTVITTKRNKWGEKMVECSCQCGIIRLHRLKDLESGRTTACRKCSDFVCKRNIIKPIAVGERYNDWLVVEIIKTPRKNSYDVLYFCECICGKFNTVDGWNLRNNKSTSCRECYLIRVKREGRGSTRSRTGETC